MPSLFIYSHYSNYRTYLNVSQVVVSNSVTLAPEERLIQQVAWILNISPNQINPNTDFLEDLYLDPIDRDLLIAKLESLYGVYLSREEAATIETIRDAGHYMRIQHAA